jgi:hypothetical protein
MIRVPSDADIEALWADLEGEPDCLECADLGETCPDCNENEEVT